MSNPTEPVDEAAIDDEIVLSWWQNPRNLITIVVTVAIIAGLVGWTVGHGRNEVKTSDVDRGFLWDMRAHHEQAVEMSLIYLGRPDIDVSIRQVARSIAFGQALEIGIMIQLLRDMNTTEVSEEGTAMTWMGMPGMDEADMPGMASDDELLALGRAVGVDADEQFLELMIAHHEGGAEMLTEAADRARNDEVRTYAAAWADAQADEVGELQGLLD